MRKGPDCERQWTRGGERRMLHVAVSSGAFDISQLDGGEADDTRVRAGGGAEGARRRVDVGRRHVEGSITWPRNSQFFD